MVVLLLVAAVAGCTLTGHSTGSAPVVVGTNTPPGTRGCPVTDDAPPHSSGVLNVLGGSELRDLVDQTDIDNKNILD